MSNGQTSAFSTLLNTWRQHQELRSSGANIAALNASRTRLDEARVMMQTAH